MTKSCFLVFKAVKWATCILTASNHNETDTQVENGVRPQEQPSTTQAGRDLIGDSLMDKGAKLLC